MLEILKPLCLTTAVQHQGQPTPESLNSTATSGASSCMAAGSGLPCIPLKVPPACLWAPHLRPAGVAVKGRGATSIACNRALELHQGKVPCYTISILLCRSPSGASPCRRPTATLTCMTPVDPRSAACMPLMLQACPPGRTCVQLPLLGREGLWSNRGLCSSAQTCCGVSDMCKPQLLQGKTCPSYIAWLSLALSWQSLFLLCICLSQGSPSLTVSC